MSFSPIGKIFETIEAQMRIAETPIGILYTHIKNRLRMVDDKNGHEQIGLRPTKFVDDGFEACFESPIDGERYKIVVVRDYADEPV